MGQKPSYIDRMEHFILHDRLRLSLHELRLFLYLFHLNNKAMWGEWFEADNFTLAAGTRLQERNLIRAKNGLKEKGLISYQPGRRGKPTKYKLLMPGELDTLSNCTVQNDSITDSVTDSVTDRETTSQSQAPQGTAGPLRHKTKDKRHREGRKKQVFSPPTLEEVRAYVEEKGLPIDPKHFYDYFTAGDWHDSKGQKVKSWKQKAITWGRYSKQEAPPPPSYTMTMEEQERRQREQEERELAYIRRMEAKA